MGILRDLGHGLYKLFIGIIIVAFLGGTLAIANYAVTQGAGTNFGSIVVGGTIHYAQQLLCDPTTPSQCTAVSAGGAAKVDGSAVTQPVSGTVTANAGTNLNTSTLATSANQTNASQKAQIVDGSGNVIASTSNALNVNVSNASTDPCTNTKVNVAIATSSGTVQLVAPSGSTQVYVCSFSIIGAATAVINLVGGTGATCTTGTPVAAIGSTTAASGMSLPANGGLTFGSGLGTVARTTTAGHGLCLIQSGTTALAGNITYVQQ